MGSSKKSKEARGNEKNHNLDSLKMMRHVIAMTGVSASLAICLQMAPSQAELALADELANGAASEYQQVDAAGVPDAKLPPEILSSAESAPQFSENSDSKASEAKGNALQDKNEPGAANTQAPTDGKSLANDAAGAELENPSGGETGELPNYEKVEDGAYSIISSLGKALDVDGASTANCGNVQTWDENYSAAQRFYIRAEGQADSGEWYYGIRNVNSGKMLDCEWGGTSSGTNVQQYESNGTGAQKWFLRPTLDLAGNKTWQIVNVASGLVLDVKWGDVANGTNVHLYEANGTAAQQWLLKKCVAEIQDGAYVITSGLGDAYVIDIDGGSGQDCATAQIYQGNDTLAQAFAFNYDERTGYYTITNYGSGKVLDLANASADNGTRIQQYGANGTMAQYWQLIKHGDGSFSFLSAVGGGALDVRWAEAANGTRLQNWTYNNSLAQRFFLAKTNPTCNPNVVRMVDGDNTRLVADVKNGDTDEGGVVQLYEWNGTFAQKMAFESDGEGGYYIRLVGSGLYLSADESGKITQQEKSSAFQQRWYLNATDHGHFSLSCVDGRGYLGLAGATRAQTLLGISQALGLASSWNFLSEALIQTGLYTIASASNSNYVLDVSGADFSYGANIQLYESNGTNAQKFYIQDLGDGTYAISNLWSALSLDVANGDASAGANVQQYGWNATKAQLWKVCLSAGGFLFKSALGEFGLSSSGAWNGSNIQLADYNEADVKQLFRITATSAANESMYNRLSVLDYIGGNGMTVFKSIKGLSSSTQAWIWDALNQYWADGEDVGFVMMDLNSGAGVAYNMDKEFYSASTIKGPYVTAVCKWAPWALGSYGGYMYDAINTSSNSAYGYVRNQVGDWAMSNMVNWTHAWSVETGSHYTWYNAHDLAKMWVGMYDFFMSGDEGASWCRDVYSSNNWITSRDALDYKCTIYAKSGWITAGYPICHNEGCIVMDGDHPYVMAIMSSANADYETWKMANLQRALDCAHRELLV